MIVIIIMSGGAADGYKGILYDYYYRLDIGCSGAVVVFATTVYSGRGL